VFTDIDEDCAPVIDERKKLENGEPVSQEERNEGWFVLDSEDTETLPLGFEVPSGRYKVTFESNTDLKDYEYVPLKNDVNRFFEEEVLPYVPDAWMNRDKDRIGYEINFTRHFYDYEPPRDVDEIDAELKMLEDKIADMLQEVTV
jgi:type I restriction enzyme M protein